VDLYVMRHGIAADVGEQGACNDSERPLTPEGRRKTRDVAKGLAALDVRPDCIGTSPLLRARETAELAAKQMRGSASPELCDFLKPGGKIEELIRWLNQTSRNSVLIVGHMPDLARIISRFFGSGSDMDIELKKAGVCRLLFEGQAELGKGRLSWLMTPAQLRELGKSG